MTTTTSRVDAREAAAATPAQARRRYRDGLVAPTSGWATGFTQANMVVVPQGWAYDMLLFGLRNPQPVPLLDATDAGATGTALAEDVDLRTDLPLYRVWRDGELVGEPTDVVGDGADAGGAWRARPRRGAGGAGHRRPVRSRLR